MELAALILRVYRRAVMMPSGTNIPDPDCDPAKVRATCPACRRTAYVYEWRTQADVGAAFRARCLHGCVGHGGGVLMVPVAAKGRRRRCGCK